MSNLSPQTLHRLQARAAEEGSTIDALINRLLDPQPTLQARLNLILEMIADGADLFAILEQLVYVIEGYQPSTRGSILLLDAQTQQLHLGAAPSLPASFNAAVDGVKIGARVGSCGTAAYEKRLVISGDIQSDPLWADYRELAAQHGLRACWSQPIMNEAGDVLGTFALYYAQPHHPTPNELGLIQTAAHIAGIAIRRKQAETALEEERQNLVAFQKIAIAIGGTLKLDHVLDILLDQLAQLIPYDRASIMLFGEGKLSFCKWRGFSAHYDFAKTESFLKDPVTWEQKGYHLELEQPIITPDVQLHPAWVNLSEEDAAVHSWMGIPLIYQGVILGVLNLDHYSVGFFTEEHAQLAYAVARQASIAIAIAQLFENLEALILQRTQEVQVEKDRSETILRHVADAIVFTDEQANIQFVNQAWEELNGYTLAEVQGKNARLLQSGRTSPTVYQEMWAALRAGKLWKGDLFNQRKDGSTYQGELTAVPVYLNNKQMQGFVGVMRDVTERRELDSLKERFIADAAHDLGNPVTVLTTTLYLLRKNPTQLEQRLPVLDYQVKRLNLLVRDLLTISRLDRGHKLSEIEPIDLAQLTGQIVQAQHALALEKQIDLRFTVQPNLPRLKGDIQAIERVIVNLISNALIYTPAGGRVEVLLSNDDHTLTLQVKDTGIGVPPHEVKQIFKRFFRSDQARLTADGTGLGLSIVEKIVEQHGGNVAVESALGLGSTFFVNLPY